MNEARSRALQSESEFLAGVQANLTQSAPRLLRGSWFERSEDQDPSAVRAALIDAGIFDRGLEKEFPGCRRIILRGFERRLIFFRREASRTIVTVLSPPEALLDGGSPRPVTLADLKAHVRKNVGSTRTPTLIAVCAPHGFEPEAWNTRWDQPNVRVVLVSPRDGGGDGGWKVRPLWEQADLRIARLFDPEAVTDKLKRIRNTLEERGGDLLTGGVSARTVASELDLPISLVEQAFEAICRGERELQARRVQGQLLVFRGAPVDDAREGRAMSVAEWVRSLFSREGNEAKKINELAARRAQLAQRRDRLYEDIGRLESKENALVEEGKKSTSAVVRRRLAAQVAQLRRDISRQNTTAAMLNQQINVISTDIHNLTLIQQGQMARLPSSEELTEHAVAAEELLETLRAETDLVTGLETGVAETMLTDEEAAILREFEGEKPTAQAIAADASTEAAGEAAAELLEWPMEPDEPKQAERPKPVEPARKPERAKESERSGPAAE